MKAYFLRDGVPHEALTSVLERSALVLFEFPLNGLSELSRLLLDVTGKCTNRVDIHSDGILWRLISLSEDVQILLTPFLDSGNWPYHLVFLTPDLRYVAAIEDGEKLIVAEVGDEVAPVVVGYPPSGRPCDGPASESEG